MPGKTRTTSAHGPTSTKKPYKATSTPKPPPSGSHFKKPFSKPSTTSSTSSSTTKRPRAEDVEKKVVSAALKDKSDLVGTSLLNAPEEVDFVRGGGSGLTQVEVKEARLEGEKEAADEEKEARERDTEVPEKSKAKRRKLERERVVAEIKEKNVLPKDAFRIEHLNYKRLIPGTKVLGQIVQVRPLELIVSLPNQLLAHIPITNISSEYTRRLEEDASASDSDDDDDSDDEDGLPPLSALFKEGEWVSAVVAETGSSDAKGKLGGRDGDETVRASRRVTLSLEAEKVNEGVAQGDLRAGFTLTASVKSVEDHGYVLNLGLESMGAFLKFKDAVELSEKPLEVGAVVAVRIRDVSENGRTCTVSVDRKEVVGSFLSAATSISSILPSTLVTALVTATLPAGLNVKFLGFFDGSIDLYHLSQKSPEKDFKVGQKLKARVLWDSLKASGGKTFSLSLAKHVMELGVAKVEETGDEVKEAFPVGRKLENVKVVGLDDEWGLTVEIEEGEDKVAGFVHISHITDDHLASIPKSGPWKVGTFHPARVVGYSAVDGLVQLSFQPSVLARSFLRVQDVEVGSIVKGTIKRLGDNALFVEISGNVDGVVWPIHYADIKLKHPEKKFKAGASVKARIFNVDPVKNRVVLTLKRQLVTSELPIVASLQDAKVGVLTHGTITKVLDNGILVDFFGGLRALVPVGEAAVDFTESSDLPRLFPVGKVIPVRLINVDSATGRIVASARQAQENSTPAQPEQALEIGTVTSGEIVALHATNLVLTLKAAGQKALMSYSTLARHRGVTVEVLRAELEKGQTIEDLVVVSVNAEKGVVIVGLVPSKSVAKPKPAPAATDITFETLKVGQKLTGKITGKVPAGLLVQLARNVRGRVPINEIADNYDILNTAPLSQGATVDCIVLSVDPENRRADLSLRPSRINGATDARDPFVDSFDTLKVGQTVRGFVKNIANHGVFVSLGTEITARVQIKELFDEFVKEWKPRFSVGQLVEGKVIKVDKVQGQVEVSLRKNANVKETESTDISELEVGQVVKGTVRRVETYGVFIRIDGTSLSGLCHKSKVTDDEDAKWTDLVHVEDKVKAIITDINVETKKISLGLKPSLFPEGAASDSDEEEAEEDDDDEEDDDEDEQDDEDDDDEDESDDEDEDEDVELLLQGADEDSDVDMAPVASTSKLAPTTAAPLAVGSGFKWDGADEDSEEDAPAAEEDDSDAEEVVPETSTSASKKRKADLSTLDDRTGDLDTQTPTSVGDFERLLLGSPNSSYLWIQYLAFYVGLSQLDKARAIGQRALKAINFREEQEKLNVWVALLNLENTYGDEETLEALFKEAVQSNDAKTVHLRLIDIYERTGKFEPEEELFKKTVKKFGQSSKVWTLFAQFYLTRGRPDDARELLPRSLKSLEKRKHVKTIAKFAQLEFKLGDAERGRTIFEGIMDTCPKRLDLWFVYIDMEIKQRAVARVRALFDRVLAQRLSSKKGKSVFKKWLTFEKEFGDEAGVEACKSKALAFVESL